MIYLASLKETISDKVEGHTVLSTMEDIYHILADNQKANTLIIREDFASAYFTPSGLSEFIDNARRLNNCLTIKLDESATVVTQDKFINKIKGMDDIAELMLIAEAYPKEYFDSIKNLVEGYGELNTLLLQASSRVSSLQKTIDTLRKEKADLEHSLRIEQDNKLSAAANLNALVKRINYQYGIKIEDDKLFQVDKNSYDKIIYIKEITRVQYLDTFIFYLKEILKVLYSMPTRLVVIESYYGTMKPMLYPTLVCLHRLTERDVLLGDILMLGLQPMLMQDILRNPSNISILIVLDKGGYIVPHISGTNVEYFYTASCLDDIPQVIPKSRVISYSKDTLFIPYIKGFENLDKGTQMSKYSSMGITKKIVSLIEGVNSNG